MKAAPPAVRYSRWSLIATILILTQIVPASIVPVREARADGVANGVCTHQCIQQPNGSFFCQADPNDPDCTGGGTGIPVTQFCSCWDLTAFAISGEPNAEICNQPDTCLSHGGWRGGDGNTCQCHDGAGFEIDTPPNSAICNTSETCSGHGGWVGGGGVTIAQLKFFQNPTAWVRRHDPETGALLSNESFSATEPLQRLETRAIADVRAAHGLPATQENNVSIWARDRVRAELFGLLAEIALKPAAERTSDEAAIYTWLQAIVWQRRIDAAQAALGQYNSLRYAAEFATCDWHSPSTTVVKLGTDANGNVRNVETTGCSPGVDGIPNTDPTPNSGTPAQIAAGLDDGETCFAFDEPFTRSSYDGITLSRCAGVPQPWDVFGIHAHPTVEQFLEYGYALADQNIVVSPGVVSVLGNTHKALAFGIGAGTAAVTAGIAGRAIYAAGGWSGFIRIFPYAARTTYVASKVAGQTGATIGASLRLISALASATLVLEILLTIVTAVTTLLDIIGFTELPIKLKQAVTTAQGETETSFQVSENYTFKSGKPDLGTLIASDGGKEELFRAFITTVSPEKDLSAAVAPTPDSTLTWAVRDPSQQPVLIGTPGTRHLLPYTSWEGSEPYAQQRVSLYEGWFNTEVELPDGSVVRALDLGIDYKDCEGKERRAWRVPNREFVTIAQGTAFEDADPGDTEQGDSFSYLDWSGQCRTARINHRPVASGLVVSGAGVEGSPTTLIGTASDPDGDALLYAWDLGDGSTTTGGASIQHSYGDDGTFTVRLVPTDVFGATGAARTEQVTIANLAPAIVSLDLEAAEVEEGSPAVLDTTYADPGHADTIEVDVDWGDGGTSLETPAALPASGVSRQSHVYADGSAAGSTFPIAVVVTDDDGASASGATSVVVRNVPPSATLVAPTEDLAWNQVFQLAVEGASDPSPVDQAAGFAYAFRCPGQDFGAFAAPTPGPVATTCVARGARIAEVGARVRDKDGGVRELTTTVSIPNVPPQVLGLPVFEPIVPGSPFTIRATFSDDRLEGSYVATFDWGDGTQSIGSVVLGDGAGTATGTHTYASGGSYTVTVRVTDPEGATSEPLGVEVPSVTAGCRVNGVLGLCVGTPGRDRIIGSRGDDVIFGGDGNDTIRGEGGNDRLYGGAGNDKLIALNGKDLLVGGDGDDDLRGGAGDDVLDGGSGNDRLTGHTGDDVLLGGEGDDRLLGRAGADRLDGGTGNDRLDGGTGSDACGDADQAGPFRGCETPLPAAAP